MPIGTRCRAQTDRLAALDRPDEMAETTSLGELDELWQTRAEDAVVVVVGGHGAAGIDTAHQIDALTGVHRDGVQQHTLVPPRWTTTASMSG